MSPPEITGVDLGGGAGLPLLVVGPSLGTSATALWSAAARCLTDSWQVVAWDLPGHGGNSHGPGDGFTMAELAMGVLDLVNRVQSERGDMGTPFAYAGDSIGGAVGQQLLLDAPERVSAAVLLCTAARFGDPAGWHERAALVRAAGTSAMVSGSAQRWFAEGFLDNHREIGATLLHSLRDADRFGYAAACEALAGFDVRARLGEIATPLLVIAGEADIAAPPHEGQLVADSVQHGRLVVLPGVGHLAPAEAPERVAQMLREHLGAANASQGIREAGLRVRRQVLGDRHVDEAQATRTEFTEEFQDLITRYAWGEIWSRPGLDRRSRSLITLTAMIARGHHDEFAMHVQAARRNGLSNDEIKELILQCAIYCGVPDANTAFRIAQKALEQFDHPSQGKGTP